MSLIAWYPLNGDVLDHSGNGKTAYNVGSTIDPNGKTGSCYNFNGSGSYNIYTPGITEALESFTISFWVYYRDYTYPKTFGAIKKSNGWSPGQVGWDFGHGYNGTGVDVMINDGVNVVRTNLAFNSGSRPPDLLNKWHHLTYIVDRNLKKVFAYVDGTRQTANVDISIITGKITNPSDFIIGTLYGWQTDGKINDVRIYNNVLSSKEVYDLSKAKVLHYKFNNYREEPTTNLALYPDYSNRDYNTRYDINGWGGDDASVYYYSNGGYNNLPYKKMIKELGGDGGSFIDEHYGFTIENNTIYTVSAYMKSSTPIVANGYSLCLNRNSDNAYITSPEFSLTTEWIRCVWTFTSSSTAFGIYNSRQIIYIDINLPIEIFWCGFQVEQKSYATPFVNGIRSGVITDCSEYGKDAVLDINSPKWIGDNRLGSGCYELNGVNQKISGTSVFSSNDFSVFVWINPQTPSNGRNTIIANGYPYSADKGWLLCLQSNYSFFLSIGGDNAYAQSDAGVITNDIWNFIGVTVTNGGSSFKLYLNGVQIPAPIGIQSTRNIQYDINTFLIGNRGAEYFKGQIDDVKIYATTLSDTEVMGLYKTRAILDDVGHLIVEQVKYMFPKSAYEIKQKYPNTKSGVYTIQLDVDSEPFDVYCDMTTDGGGYMLLGKSNLTDGIYPGFNSSDNSIPLSNYAFSRVGYRLTRNTEYIWTSFDTMTSDKIKLAPSTSMNWLWDGLVNNMTVVSNVATVTNGTGYTGKLEIWPSDYGPTAATGTYSYNDVSYSTGAGHSCFQIHNWSLAQVGLCYNHWRGAGYQNDYGIGPQSTGQPDWTFAANAGNYTTKSLEIWVR